MSQVYIIGNLKYTPKPNGEFGYDVSPVNTEIPPVATPPAVDLGGVPARNDNQANGTYGEPSDTNPYNLTKNPGESDADFRARINNTPFNLAGGGNGTVYKPVYTLNANDAKSVAAKAGLAGLGFDSSIFEGLTQDQADSLATRKKSEMLTQNTPNTSATFDPAKYTTAKNISDKFTIGLNDATSNPWSKQQDKKTATKTLIDKTSSEFASLFTDPQSFLDSVKVNPDFMGLMKDYLKAGGTLSDVASRLKNNVDTQMPNDQSVADYLSQTVYQPKAANDAEASLAPEQATTHDEIARLAGIPKQYYDLYFGTPEKKGLLDQKLESITSKIDLLNTTYANSAKTTQDTVTYQKQKNQMDADKELTTIESNRLAAKNYLTGMLAKLGALTTSGEAPVALSNVEAKYNQQANDTRNALMMANSQLDIKQTEELNRLESEKQSKIQSIKDDYSTDEATARKEIQRVTDDADSKINAAIDKYNTIARSTYEKYMTKADKDAQAYVKTFLTTISGGLSDKYLQQLIPTIFSVKNNKKTPSGNPTMDAEIENAVSQLQQIVKTKGFWGVSPDDFNTFAEYFQNKYRTKGAGALKTALGRVNLKIDTNANRIAGKKTGSKSTGAQTP